MLDKKEGFIWMDGQFVPWQQAQCHILTHTLHYGSGVFEGERAYHGKIFKMNQHHQRLHASAALLDFKIPYSVEELNDAACECIKRNNLTEAYIRPVAWHGSESLNVSNYKNSVHVAIAAWEWKFYFSQEDLGLKVMWSEWVRPAPNMSPVHAKANGQYITGTLSKNKAELSGYQDAMMLDYRGYVAECTGANVFMVKNGVAYTPIADCFLNGITRQTIIELLKKCDISIKEKYITPAEIAEADEIFVTGSAVEVQPIIQLGERKYPVGPITRRMMDEYHHLVRGTNHV